MKILQASYVEENVKINYTFTILVQYCLNTNYHTAFIATQQNILETSSTVLSK